MGNYELTLRGKVALALLFILAVISIVKGSIYLAVFSFVFLSLVLVITLYEVFLNK